MMVTRNQALVQRTLYYAQTCCMHTSARGHAALAETADVAHTPRHQDTHPSDTFYARDLRITHTTTPQPLPTLEDLRFGQTFTDHMFMARHVAGRGWEAPEIVPFGAIPLHPAAQVLHYGVSCFEGMKAFKGVDGRGRLFRPELNMQRLQRSARRLLLADFDTHELLECLKALLRVDARWLPDRLGYSMYIRPYMFSTGRSLGVARSNECALNIIMSPVGPYFKTGLRPVTLFLDEQHVRAWPGGVGQYKIGGNYAPTLLPQEQANRGSGTPQVVYTIAPAHAQHRDDALLSESGAMNFFVLMEKPSGGGMELVTPPLDGTILPGVTRDSILQLTKQWGEFAVSERPLSIREIVTASRGGHLREMFGCGTACVVQPVQALVRADGEVLRADFDVEDPTSLTRRLTQQLVDIQYGRVEHPWSVPIDE